MTRIKYEHLRDNSTPAPNSLCFGLFEEYEKEQQRARVEAEKHAEAQTGDQAEDVEMV